MKQPVVASRVHDHAHQATLRPSPRGHLPGASAGLDPAEIAERAGNSVNVLMDVYATCIDDKSAAQNKEIDDAPAEDDEERGTAETDRAQSFCMLMQKSGRWCARQRS